MEVNFTPKYKQPFTLAQVCQLEPPLIIEGKVEINRLQNSIRHLNETQVFLKDSISIEGADPEIVKAVEENVTVIASQEERLSILKLALTQKGILGGAHYDVTPTKPSGQSALPGTTASTSSTSSDCPLADEEGAYL